MSVIHVVGYATAGLGLGEVLRRLVGFLSERGVTVGVHDLRSAVEDRGRDLRLTQTLPESSFSRPIGLNEPVIYCVNPDQLGAALSSFPTGGRKIAIWFWELEHWPRVWYPAFDWVDEVWASSAFIAESLSRAQADLDWRGQIHRVPLPLLRESRSATRLLTIREDPRPAWWDLWVTGYSYRIYFAFDCHSVFERKNPLALVAGFLKAFPNGKGLSSSQCQPKLLIRALHPERDPQAVQCLKEATQGDERIFIATDYLDSALSTRLIDLCDVYCSPHRSEGLGLGIAEAMLACKPVITTPWSGNLDFCRDPRRNLDFGIHLDFELVDVAPDAYPHAEGARWADPKVDSLAQALLSCWNYPAWAATVGTASKRHVAAHFNGDIFLRQINRLIDAAD